MNFQGTYKHENGVHTLTTDLGTFTSHFRDSVFEQHIHAEAIRRRQRADLEKLRRDRRARENLVGRLA